MTLPPIPSDKGINRELPLYRSIEDPYCEPGLISVMFLGCGRHDVTKFCLEKLMTSLLRSYDGPLEWIFLEQGWDINSEESAKNLLLFKKVSVDLDRSVIIVPNKNYGINVAINQMNQIARGQYSLLMENDWVCHQITSQWLTDSKMILDEWDNVGVVQLRAIHDPNDNHGKGKVMYNPFSVESCSYVKKKSMSSGVEFLLATHRFAGINNNPSLIRKAVHRELGPMREPELWSDLRHGETDREEKYMKTQWLTAHLIYNVFFHHKP
jgi:hypothetical protein